LTPRPGRLQKVVFSHRGGDRLGDATCLPGVTRILPVTRA